MRTFACGCPDAPLNKDNPHITPSPVLSPEISSTSGGQDTGIVDQVSTMEGFQSSSETLRPGEGDVREMDSGIQHPMSEPPRHWDLLPEYSAVV